MAGVLRDGQKNRMLNLLGGRTPGGSPITHASLHTGYPPTSGNEATGGSPAYARQAVTFGSDAASGSIALTSTPVTFDVPAMTVASVAFQSHVSNDAIEADDDVTDEVFAAQGTYSITAGTFDLDNP